MQYFQVKDPDKLLQLGTLQEIEDKIITWLGVLKDSGKATATMRTVLVCMVFFYSCNPGKNRQQFICRKIPKKPALPYRRPTKEELAAIIEAGNLRGKALVGMLASTGIRLSAIPLLKIRHLRKVKPEELEHHDCSCKDRPQPLRFNGYVLKMYDGEEEQYFTFLSEEASK